jgi:putative iron-only hydrogenase system regulator
MEKRIGTITVLLLDRAAAAQVNEVISAHSGIVLARQGLPFHDRPVAVISLIVEGEVDEINSLSGQLGKIQDVTAKAVLTKFIIQNS